MPGDDLERKMIIEKQTSDNAISVRCKASDRRVEQTVVRGFPHTQHFFDYGKRVAIWELFISFRNDDIDL